jgi:trk system potassium uptake protein TrkH
VSSKSTKNVVENVALLDADGSDFGKELVNWLFPAYVTLIVVSIFLFLSKSMMAQGNAMSFDRAVLSAVNAATLTGFQQKLGPNYFKGPGQFLVLMLTVAGSLFSLIVGGLAVKRILRLRFSDRQIIRAAWFGEGIALLIGAAGGCGVHRTLLQGLSQGASAFGNSGMALGRPFAMMAWQTHLIVLPMVCLGGLGITVLMELYDLLVHARPLTAHSRTVLGWSVGVYLVGVLIFSVLQWIAGDWALSQDRAAHALVSSSVAAINTRTAGIPFDDVSNVPKAMRWVMSVFMMIGAAPGGTGGGLKITTIAVIFAGTRGLLRGEKVGRALGIALSWVGIYLGIALLGLVMLLFVEPQLAGEQVLYLTISALSNVGLSYDQLPDMPKGAFVLAALMMAGRMVPLLILWWMADSTRDGEVAIG